MTMRRARWALLAGIAWGVVWCGGCGGGVAPVPSSTGGGSNLGNYTGATGGLRLQVDWPEAGGTPDYVDAEISGQGLAKALTLRIARAQSEVTLESVPVGQKGIALSSRSGDEILFYGFNTASVASGSVAETRVTVLPAADAGVALARALVQDVRDTNVALTKTVATEAAAVTATVRYDLLPTYSFTLQRMQLLTQLLGVLDETSGTYKVTVNSYDELEFVRTGTAAANTWVVRGPDNDVLGEGWYTTFTQSGGTNNLELKNLTFRTTCSKDAKLLFQGSLQFTQNALRRVTGVTLNGTFRDKFLPDGITINGSLTGTALTPTTVQQPYGQITFNGTIDSPKVKAALQATAAGNINVALPDRESSSSRLDSLQIQTLQARFLNVEEPATLTLSGAVNLRQVNGESLPASGNLNLNYQSNGATVEGAMQFTWSNPQSPLVSLPRGTASFTGSVAAANKPVFSTRFDLTSNAPPAFRVAIDLTRGTHYLRGACTGKAVVTDGDVELTQWYFDLQNENRLRITYGDTSTSGVIKTSAGTLVANVQEDPDLHVLVVRYSDGTVESLTSGNMDWQHTGLPSAIQGTVKDGTGRALAGVQLGAYEVSSNGYVGEQVDDAVTSSTGAYKLEVPTGQYMVGAWKSGFYNASQSASVTSRTAVTLNLKMLALGPVTGTIIDASTRAAIPNAVVWWDSGQGDRSGADRSRAIQGSWVLTSSTGRFTLPAGSQYGWIAAQAYQHKVVYQAPSPALSIALPRAPGITGAAVLTGTVKNSTGQVIPNAVVTASGWTSSGSWGDVAVTSSTGVYRFSAPPNTNLTVSLQVAGSQWPRETAYPRTGASGTTTRCDFIPQAPPPPQY